MHRLRGLRILLIAAGILCLAAPFSAWARGPLQVGDHHPIKIDSRGPSDVEPTITAAGVVYKITHPQATYIAIHFSSFDLADGDYLTVSEALGGQSYRLEGKGKMGAGKFWSRHVKGDTAVLTYVTSGQEAAKGFVVDKYAAGFVELPTPGIEAICGVDDKENAICYETSHPDEYGHARAVARLLIAGSSLCTGWLVSANDHLLTNQHCIGTVSDALNTDYEFMSEAPTCGSANCQLCYPGTVFSGATFIQNDAGLDYTLVQITSGSPASTYGYLEIDNRVATVGEQIFIPQHPGGRAKEFGIYSSYAGDTGGVCRVYSITEPPCSGTGYSDVGYFCDTEGGSSGSPVLATSNYKVIALHHCADCPNRGVPIHLVYAEIADIIVSSGLKVNPGTGLDSAGDVGGPFTPDSEVYTLENLNDTGLDYTVSKDQTWISLSDTGGYLAGHATTDVTVSINSNANSLPEGLYSGTVDFVNVTDHDGDTSRPVSLTVGVPEVVYEWTLDTDPGWTTEGLWAFGVPTGGGGQYGGPDPTSGYTGSNVYGYNLAGDYENYLPERHLTSGAIDCSNLSAVTLKFWRWLGVEQPAYDHAYVRVSNDGTNWTTVWTNSSVITDTAWVQQEYDISAVADGQPTVYLRWTMGTTDSSWQYCGWNIDDIQLWALGGEPECYVDSDCDDASECTTDTCVGGYCQYDPITCDDSNACTADSCDPLTGCVYDPITCDDGDACTIDSCDTVTGCVYDPVVCEPGYVCDDGICVPSGCDNDGTCEVGEDCTNCPNDCISGSGGCGNGVCEPSLGEDCLSCPGDCAGTQTGKPSGRYCCGDGDGVNPVGCADARCISGGYQCSNTPSAYCCGDLVCQGAETPYNCAIDCGPPPVCPDGSCDPGEDQCSCPADCGTPPSTETNCSDGVDNDCDTLVDCVDALDCGTDPACICLARGETCTLDSECCSNRCHRGTCK